MQERFDAELQRLADGKAGDCKFLLAVSGGIDSMVMATLFSKSCHNPYYAVAHMNFSLRAEESDGDEALVRDWCQTHGTIFHRKQVNTLEYAEKEGISVEMAARDLRYTWFEELCRNEHYDFVVVAHNMNDNAETLMLNLLRGAGLRGVSGMRSRNGRVVRPLLCFSRTEIEGYASECGIEFRTDSTNLKSDFARNRIRNEVFPQFSRINPSFLATLDGDMRRLAQAQQVLDELYASKEGALYRMDEGVLLIDGEALKSMPHRQWWLFRMLDGYGFNESQLSDIDSALDAPSGKQFRSVGHILVRDRKYLKVYPLEDNSVDEPSVTVYPVPDGFDPRKLPSGVLCLDADKIGGPIIFRSPLPGDRFRPFGMKGSRLLSDFFSDLKLDIQQKKRELVALFKDSEGKDVIVAVVGRRIDDRFRIDGATRLILELSPQLRNRV